MTGLIIGKPYLWEKKSQYLWIIDAGHGGIDDDGKYTTAPAKMHHHTNVVPAFTIYEGVINREIADRVTYALLEANIDYAHVYDEVEDTSLPNRVNTADAIYAKDKRAIYLSIHSNAGGGTGFEVFTSPGQTKSDKIANIFCEVYKKNFPNFPFRSDKSDHDDDKESAFFVLRKTDCPSILVENLFFDNLKEAEFLMSQAGQDAIANCIVDAIKTCEQLKPI